MRFFLWSIIAALKLSIKISSRSKNKGRYLLAAFTVNLLPVHSITDLTN